LHTYGSVAAGVCVEGAIDDLEVGRVLVQTHLKVQRWWHICAAGHFLELDVEDAVGRSPRYGGKDPLPVSGIQIVQVGPVRGDQVIHGKGRQADVVESGVAADELDIAVGGNVKRTISLVVEVYRERQSDSCDTVVSVVAAVGGAGHDRAGGAGNCVIANRARGSWRRRSSSAGSDTHVIQIP